jgi:hypothetical protein
LKTPSRDVIAGTTACAIWMLFGALAEALVFAINSA